MQAYECEGRKVELFQATIQAEDPTAAADQFRALHGVDPESIGEDRMVGRCAGCGRAILQGHPHRWDAGRQFFCGECGPRAREEAA